MMVVALVAGSRGWDRSTTIALVALLLSALALWRTRAVDKRDNLLRLHHEFTLEDLQRGRRLAHQLGGRPIDENHHDWDAINRAVALMDVIGLYVAKGYVDKESALELWKDNAARLRADAHGFIEYRRQQYPDLWPRFDEFARLAGWKPPGS